MEIEAASIDQLKRADNGRMVLIEADVGNVVADLQAIDGDLKVRYSEAGDYFVLYKETPLPDGSVQQDLVLTSQKLDQRIVKRFQQISHESYDFVKEMEKKDAQADRDKEHEFEEKVGAIGEKLAHSLRKDLGHKKDAGYIADMRKRSGEN